jgi:hypothetical protein
LKKKEIKARLKLNKETNANNKDRNLKNEKKDEVLFLNLYLRTTTMKD